jgi:hypothetical protein
MHNPYAPPAAATQPYADGFTALPISAVAPLPMDALICPKCNAGAMPNQQTQRCPKCGLEFLLLAGAALDPTITPAQFDPNALRIKVKSAGIALMTTSTLDPLGLTSGEMDPVTGMIPISQSGIAYPNVATLAVWRRIDIKEIFVACILPIPIAIGLTLVGVISAPGMLPFALLFMLISAFMLYRGFGRRANFVRVCGSGRSLRVRFDRPGWRRQKFYAELMRRCGLPFIEIP